MLKREIVIPAVDKGKAMKTLRNFRWDFEFGVPSGSKEFIELSLDDEEDLEVVMKDLKDNGVRAKLNKSRFREENEKRGADTMQIKESLDRLVSILGEATDEAFDEYFSHIAEALEIDEETMGLSREDREAAIVEAVKQIDEADVEDVVEEINLFFNEEEDLSEGKGKYKKEESDEDEDEDEDEDGEEDEVVVKTKKESYHISSTDLDFSDDLGSMFEGELTEEFQEKAKTIFEAAVVRKVNEKVDQIVEDFADILEEKTQEIEEEMVDNLDKYLDYVISEWVDENRVAISSGVRNEVTESFIRGLHGLFEDHYIDVPEEKVEMIEELRSKVEELEGGLNESLEENANLRRTLKESKLHDIQDELMEGLTEMQKDKFRTLIEGVDERDLSAYKMKLAIIKENYFSNDDVKVDTLTEDYDDDENVIHEDNETNKAVLAYTKALDQIGGRK